MRLPVVIVLFSLLVVAAGTHRLPLLKQQSSFASKRVPSARHNSKFASLLTGARNDPAESDGYGFAVQVQIGTPAQLFYAEVALGSAELWIADSSCQYWTDCDDNCINNCHRFTCEGCCYLPDHCLVEVPYESSFSSTYRTEGQVWDVNDGLSGILGYDAIALDAGVSLPIGEFVQVTSLGDWATPCEGACQNVSGVLGLGLSGLSPTGTPSVFQQAYEAGAVEKPLVGLWMNTSDYAAEGAVVGELTFGDWDHEKCGEVVVFLPVAGPDSRWTFWIDGAQIGKYELGNAWRAGLDLDFHSWSVPEQLYKAILQGTNSEWDESIYQYVVDCDQNTPLTLTTDGGDLVIPFSAFSFRYDADRCALGLSEDSYEHRGELTFGTPFLTLFCAVFDYEKQQFGYAAIN